MSIDFRNKPAQPSAAMSERLRNRVAPGDEYSLDPRSCWVKDVAAVLSHFLRGDINVVQDRTLEFTVHSLGGGVLLSFYSELTAKILVQDLRSSLIVGCHRSCFIQQILNLVPGFQSSAGVPPEGFLGFV